MKGDDLYKEREHIKFWDNCLNDLKKQFEIMSNLLDLIKKIKIQIMTELGSIISKYKTDTIPFNKEPSHIYSLSEIYFNFISFLWDVVNKYNDDLYSKINSMNLEIIKDLDIKKINLYKDNTSILEECQALINKIKTQENEFNKKKELMNEAEKNRNKIKNQVENIYNVSENKKADLLLAKSIKKMEEIKIPMEENKKKLKEYKSTLIASFSRIFENYFSTYFKHLAILYQYFYLLENNKMNILLSMQNQLKKTLQKLSNLNFELNDYTQKKFGELINIGYDGLILLDSEEIINNANSKLLLKISKDIINYVKVFMICIKYRKKIMKHFCKTSREIYNLELNIQSENQNSYDNLLTQLRSIKHTSEGTSNKWNFLILNVKGGDENQNYELFISYIEEYINFVSHELNEFDLEWKDYEEKIIEQQKIAKEYIKDIKDINKAKIKNNGMNGSNNDKFREVIKNSIKFIKDNVNNIRTKDKSKIQDFSNSFEKILVKYKNFINKSIDLTEVQISSLANLDIYEESKVIIIKYFNDVKIRNYLGFLEKMKYKLISQFQNDILNKKENEESKEDLFLSEEDSMNNLEESKSQISQENYKEEISEIKNLNLLFKDSRKFLFENNPQNNIITSPQNQANNNINIIRENSIEEKNAQNFDNISLDFLNRKKFTELTKMENPYKNIKEEELKKLKEIGNKKDEEELEKGENILDNFNCALKDKILLQGKLFITNKRIWFKSLFNTSTLFGKTTIMIPLNDIVSIEKKYHLALDNSIEVKTEKVSYFFTNYLSRDNCYNLLQEELNKINHNKTQQIQQITMTKKKISEKKIISTPPPEINTKPKKPLNPYFTKFLKDFDLEEKLKQITKERLNLFIKKYRDEKNLIFLSEKNHFSEKIFEHIFNACPLYVCFKYLCKASTQLDELGYSKGFFESILIQNISKDVIIIEKEGDENDIESWRIPDYYINEEYILDLFSSYDKEKFENLLNETQSWINKYEYNCYGMSKKIKKNSKSDLYTAYFISPTSLIFDIIHYSSNNDIVNNYIPIFRYKFDSDININESTGKFDIPTKLTVLLDIYFSEDCILSKEERNKIYIEHKNKFREWVLSKLIDVLNNYCRIFRDIYEKKSEENIIKISNEKKMVNIDNINNDFEEIEKNNDIDDIKTIKSIEINNIKITHENNYIKNINVSSSISNSTISIINNNINKNDINESNNINNDELKSEQKKTDNNSIKNIITKLKINEINIILIIIILLILFAFLLSFLKFEKILLNIINLICLGLAVFLLIKRW